MDLTVIFEKFDLENEKAHRIGLPFKLKSIRYHVAPDNATHDHETPDGDNHGYWASLRAATILKYYAKLPEVMIKFVGNRPVIPTGVLRR